jgi:DNA (cytosine-5)-methyltransferase 1
LLESLGISNPDFKYHLDHIARPHSERDLEIYKLAVEEQQQGRRIKYNTLPERLKTHKNDKIFLDRFKVVDENEKGSQTVVAHISKDGHYYIHPDLSQNRSLSVREAARLQTFPDDYKFEGTRTDQLHQIGNAVPPMFSAIIANLLIKYI